MFTFKIARSHDKSDAEKMLENVKNNKDPKWETVGPVNYFDNAFGIFKDI